MRNKVISIIFCLILALGSSTSILLPDKYYSESEKRTLMQFPRLSLENIIGGDFGDEIEQYLADQFPGRNDWVTLKTILERASGKTEINGVYFADDNYLIEVHKSLPSKQAKNNISALKMLSDALENEGISLRVMLAPTAGYILSDKLPVFAPNADQHAVIEYAKSQGLDMVDITDALMEHNKEYIYYKTDHHWTSLGAYYAYAAWLKSKGKLPEPITAWESRQLCSNFRGTTYSKVNYPFAPYDTIDAYYKSEKHEVNYNNGNYITDSIYEEKYLYGSDQYATFFNSNQATAKISGNGSGRLLIIKDSYANCFAQFVLEDYEETHLIDMRFFSGKVTDYITENNITEVLVLYNIPNFCSDISIARCCR